MGMTIKIIVRLNGKLNRMRLGIRSRWLNRDNRPNYQNLFVATGKSSRSSLLSPSRCDRRHAIEIYAKYSNPLTQTA
jgi:hypothetical protein